MIKSKKDYREFLISDLKANNLNEWKWFHKFSRRVIHFQRVLRKVEYFKNCKNGLLSRFYQKYLLLKFKKMSVNLGFTIPPNVFDCGLSIAHYGSIVVNSKAKVGKRCRIHSDTNIGSVGNSAPIIGNDVYIAPGVKIFGGVTIGNEVYIGANTVVNRDVPSNCTVVGNPARIVKINGEPTNLLLKDYKQQNAL